MIRAECYASKAAYAQLARVYRLVRLYTNFFQPVQRLLDKQRDGARLRRWDDRARTPYQRLCATAALPDTVRCDLDMLYRSLNPLQLRRDIDTALATLWRFAMRDRRFVPVAGPSLVQ